MTLHVLTDNPFAHPILMAAGCPPSGNGALVYLQQLGSALESCLSWGISASTQDWQKHVRQLSKSMSAHPSSPSSSPTAAELVNQPWGALHECIAARRAATNSAALQLDVVFVYLILEAAAGHRPLTSKALEGLKKCYQAHTRSGKLNPDWGRLGTSNIINKSELTELVKDLTYGVARQFGMTVLSYLDRSMPTPAGISAHFAQTEIAKVTVAYQGPELSADAPKVDSLPKEGEPIVQVEAESLDQRPKFERGDSILEWHLNAVPNARRNDRLGLESWNSLSVDQTCRIAARLPALMSDADSPWQRAAVLATTVLLTSTPAHVLLHAPVNQDGDLNIDIENQRFTWPIEVLRGASKSTANITPATLICIPFPAGLGQALTSMSRSTGQQDLRYLADIFQVSENSAAWSVLNRQTYDLLKELSDPAFQAFPGRWSKSVSRVYTKVASSDLVATTCSLDVSITPQAALYYFHPSQEEIRTLVQKAYDRLGLGPITLDSTTSVERGGIPTDDALAEGFATLHARTHQLSTAIQDKRSDIQSSIQNLNELNRLVAGVTVFLIGGRGSRIGEMTCGAIYCSADSLWIQDKKVEHENSSRILPKPRYLSHQLELLHLAKRSVAERLAAQLSRNRAEGWKELAAGQLRFDAPAFELWGFKNDRVTRSEVTAADIEWVSQTYFGARKNFMRHVLITHWACDGEDYNLLRLVTGHATAGLAIPAAGATYTPASAVAAAGCVLEKLLQKWLPAREDTTSIQSNYRFVSLPGRSILKAVKSARSHIGHWDAPVFSRWHLAANRIIERIRHLLLNGHAPATPKVNLWLHLVCFDAIHEASDIAAVFNDIDASFELGRIGWV
ncbi:hypothetical protein, partial [Hydrogenophaga sp. OTU3427]|uniref:hypothetical protein n=1 Tax=Hydrogenophaga sp. OTU3427 TaxID=3043856 RepID=UPI00313DA6CE